MCLISSVGNCRYFQVRKVFGNTPQHHTTTHNTTQYHTTPHNTTQHHTTPHNTTQHRFADDTHRLYTLNTVKITAHSTVLPEKLTVPQRIKKFSAFCATRKFITAFTTVSFLSQTWGRSIQWILISSRSLLILSSHLCLGLSTSSFPQVFPPKLSIHIYSPPHALHAPPISFFLIWSSNNIWRAVQVIKLLIM